MKAPRIIYRFRDALTGRFTTKKAEEERPAQTVRERADKTYRPTPGDEPAPFKERREDRPS